jgi:hypothetical protein
MNAPQRLTIDLLSETTFGGGGITPGEVEIEIDHDDLGLPRLSAKTIHGLFRDTWLSMQEVFRTDEYKESAARLFGLVADFGEETILRIGDAEVDDATRSVVRRAVTREDAPLSPRDILHALTNVRTQTSESRESGAPEEGTLRSSRVLIRGLRLFCRLEWLAAPVERDLEVLALTVLTTRHAGMARNRGRGHVRILFDGDVQATRVAGGVV